MGFRTSHPLNSFFAKLAARHGCKRAIVAVAHRLSWILYAMLRDGTLFQPQQAGRRGGPLHSNGVPCIPPHTEEARASETQIEKPGSRRTTKIERVTPC